MGASLPKSVRVVDEAGVHEIFELVDMRDGLLRVRAAYRFEVGEEMTVRLEEADGMFDAIAQVRDYTADGLAELEVGDKKPARSIVSG